MTSENKERKAFEQFIKDARSLEGVFLRDCNDICPDRTYQNLDTDYLWQRWNTRTPQPIALSEDEAVEVMAKGMCDLKAATKPTDNTMFQILSRIAYRALIAAQPAPRVSPEVAVLVGAARDVVETRGDYWFEREHIKNMDELEEALQPFTGVKTDDK